MEYDAREYVCVRESVRQRVGRCHLRMHRLGVWHEYHT